MILSIFISITNNTKFGSLIAWNIAKARRIFFTPTLNSICKCAGSQWSVHTCILQVKPFDFRKWHLTWVHWLTSWLTRMTIAPSYFPFYTFNNHYLSFSLSAGLHKVYWHLVGRMYPSRNVIQPSTVPGQALPGPAQPHPGYPWFSMPRRPGLYHQWEGKIGVARSGLFSIDFLFYLLLVSEGLWMTEKMELILLCWPLLAGGRAYRLS